MTVQPDDVPFDYFDDDNGAVPVMPFQFLDKGGVGDFRPVPVESDPKE